MTLKTWSGASPAGVPSEMATMRTGLRKVCERAGPRTSGWRIFWSSAVPRAGWDNDIWLEVNSDNEKVSDRARVRPLNEICEMSWVAACSELMLLPWTCELRKRTWIPSWSKSEAAKAIF